MNKIKEALRKELTGWKKWQVFWIIFANAMILGISIYQKDSWLGIAASITGVCCVILCGMGKVSNYFFGTINVILYAIVAWKAKYYGDVMLNLIYYFPPVDSVCFSLRHCRQVFPYPPGFLSL